MNPLAPRLALRVGVIGNRKFGDGVPDAHGNPELILGQARTACKEVIDLIASTLNEVSRAKVNHVEVRGFEKKSIYAPGDPLVRIITGLAAGSDQIAADVAVNRTASEDSKCEVRLDAILPFSEGAYVNDQDFKSDEKDLTQTLLKEAAQVICLAGDDLPIEKRDPAFRTQGHAVIYNSDLLLAIWDPEAKGGASMTLDHVRAALRKSTPVVAIHPEENGYTCRLLKEEPDLNQCVITPFASDLKKELFHQLNFAHSGNLEEEIAPEKKKKQEEAREEAGERYALLLGGQVPPRFDREFLGMAWRSFDRWFGGKKEKIKWAPEAPWLTSIRELAESIQSAYSDVYRGSFVIAYLFAALASGLAALALVNSGSTVLLLGIAKLTILGYLLWFSRRAKRFSIQERATDFRFYVEMLRPMSWLAPAGLHTPACRLPAQYLVDDPRQSWTTWLMRAHLRSFPIVQTSEGAPQQITLDRNTVTSALEGARGEWLREQIAYHENNHKRMHRIHERIEKASFILLWVLVGAVGIHVIEQIVVHCISDHHSEEHSAGLLASTLGFLAAFLPACLAALGGLAYQSEAKRLAARSEAFAEALKGHQRKLKAWENLLADPDADPVGISESERSPDLLLTWHALRYLRGVSQVMVDEVGDWKILYQAHEVHAA